MQCCNLGWVPLKPLLHTTDPFSGAAIGSGLDWLLTARTCRLMGSAPKVNGDAKSGDVSGDLARRDCVDCAGRFPLPSTPKPLGPDMNADDLVEARGRAGLGMPNPLGRLAAVGRIWSC